MAKKKTDKSKIIVRIIAGAMAVLMVLSVAAGVIYSLAR